MEPLLLNGKLVAEKLKKSLAQKVEAAKQATGSVPGIAYLLVDNDPISRHYVSGKVKACEQVGIFSIVKSFPGKTSEQELCREIDRLNTENTIHGILVQLPLPSTLNTEYILSRIDPAKDVDSFHPFNRGLLFSSHAPFAPCTPKGIVLLLKEYGIPIEGKHVVIIGRSLVVGKPLAMLMLNENATVTVCHRKTKALEEITKTAEILVVAAGRPKFLKKRHVAPGAVVVDVGIHQMDGKLVGDVDQEEVRSVVSAISPVPGGVGPMTVAMLLENTFIAFQKTGKVSPSFLKK